MSPRNFARVYTATTGRTPSKAIEFMRLEEARRLLEDTDKSVDEISDQLDLEAPNACEPLSSGT